MVNIENTNPADNLKQPEVFDMNGRLVKTYAVRQGINIQPILSEKKNRGGRSRPIFIA